MRGRRGCTRDRWQSRSQILRIYRFLGPKGTQVCQRGRCSCAVCVMDSDRWLHGDGGLMRLTGAWEWDFDNAAERMGVVRVLNLRGVQRFLVLAPVGLAWPKQAHSTTGQKMRCFIPLYYLDNCRPTGWSEIRLVVFLLGT